MPARIVDSIEFNSSRSDKLQSPPDSAKPYYDRNEFWRYAFGRVYTCTGDDHNINSSPKHSPALKQCYNRRQHLTPRPADGGDSLSSSVKTENPRQGYLMSPLNRVREYTPQAKQNPSYPESSGSIWRPDEWPSLGVMTNVNVANTRNKKSDMEILQLNLKASNGTSDNACPNSLTPANKLSPGTVAMTQASGTSECLRLLRNENSCGVTRVTECPPEPTKPLDNEPTCAYEMSDYVANYKITQVVYEVFTKIFHCDEEEGANAKDLIYKHLWVKAEAEKCAREVSVQVRRMKDIEQGLISSYKNPTSLPTRTYMHAWHKTHVENNQRRSGGSSGKDEEYDDIDGDGDDGECDLSSKASRDDNTEYSLDVHDGLLDTGICCKTGKLGNEQNSHLSEDDLDSWSVTSGKTSHDDDTEDSSVTRDKSNNLVFCTTSKLENEPNPHWSDNSSSDWELLSTKDCS